MLERSQGMATETVVSCQALEEVANFLCQMRFSANHGACAEGEHVAVTVDPRWNKDNTFQVLIHCHAFGHWQVDWEGLAVFVEAEGEGDASRVCFLNAQGLARIPSLVPGAYRLCAGYRLGPDDAYLPLNIPTAWSRAYPSLDERLTLTIGRRPTGEFVVAAETRDPLLANGTVRFSFVDPVTLGVHMRQTLTLKPHAEQKNLWEGTWVEQSHEVLNAAGDEKSVLVYRIISPSE